MISAIDALRLPGAQLSEEQEKAAHDLLDALDAHVRKHMERGGCSYQTTEVRPPVLAEVSYRLRLQHYQVQMGALNERSPLSQQPVRTGTLIALIPTDEAYLGAEALADAPPRTRPESMDDLRRME